MLTNGLKKPYFLTIMTLMKYLLMLFLMFGFSTTMLAEEAEDCVDDLTTEENECETDEAVVLSDSGDGFLGGDMSAYLVWGVGIALLSSDFGSDSGTATTN
mgnify:CR=1 FL=1